MGHRGSNPDKEIHSITGLPVKKKKREERRKKRKEKAQINNLTSHLNEIEKEQQTKPKVSTRKEIIKIRAKKEKKK